MNSKNVTRTYREAAIAGASNVELVVIMYDMIIEDLDRTIEAIASKDIEKRTNETKHILAVLEQLQGTLDMTNGGNAAVNMDRLYSLSRGKLLEASIKNSTEIVRELRTIFAELKSAWQEVEKATHGRPITEQFADVPLPIESSRDGVVCDWSA